MNQEYSTQNGSRYVNLVQGITANMGRKPISIVLTLIFLSAGCIGDKTSSDIASDIQYFDIDITNAVFSKSNASCADYVGNYFAKIIDTSNGGSLTSRVTISSENQTCTIRSNGLPNHDFAKNGSFASTTAEVWESFTIHQNPVIADNHTALSLQYDNAVFLNGVKLDLLAAACYGVGPDPLGREKIGCFNSNTPWRYDPMHSSNNFGEDDNHAHTQPDGAYHYHGDPVAMYDTSGNSASGVIGFAADGFPIRGPYIEDNGTIRAIESSYVLNEGNRTNQDGEGAFPGGEWDGRYRDDFHWEEGAGDLDECNGKVVDGVYSYYVTFSYPWVMNCFVGTLDQSFRK